MPAVAFVPFFVSAAPKPLPLTPTVATFSASRQPLVACHHSFAESPNPLRHPPSLPRRKPQPPSPPAITPFVSFGHSPAIHEQRVRAPSIICSLLAWQDIPLPMQEKRTARHDIRNSRFAMHKSAHAILISHLET